MRKRSIIFIVIAIILVVIGFAATNTSNETDIISKAVYVQDGKVLPENEGKIVIVSGEVEAAVPLVDKLTGVELPGVKARRNVDYYQRVRETIDEKTYDELRWQTTVLGNENEFGKLVSSDIYAYCKVGDFGIEDSLLSGIQVEKKYYDFDHDEGKKKEYNVITYKETTYLTPVEYMPAGGEEYQSSFSKLGIKRYYKEYENMPRISYNVQGDKTKYTFVGRQQGSKLVYDKELGMQCAFDGIVTPEELEKRVANGGIIGGVVAWVIAAFFVFLAIYDMKAKKN